MEDWVPYGHRMWACNVAPDLFMVVLQHTSSKLWSWWDGAVYSPEFQDYQECMFHAMSFGKAVPLGGTARD